jgi:hypothetical protein
MRRLSWMSVKYLERKNKEWNYMHKGEVRGRSLIRESELVEK